jgi:hypothetical protein
MQQIVTVGDGNHGGAATGTVALAFGGVDTLVTGGKVVLWKAVARCRGVGHHGAYGLSGTARVIGGMGSGRGESGRVQCGHHLNNAMGGATNGAHSSSTPC